MQNVQQRKTLNRLVLATEPMLQCARRSWVVNFNELISSDYKSFLIDADFKEYFHTMANKYNCSESRKLNLSNQNMKSCLRKIESSMLIK